MSKLFSLLMYFYAIRLSRALIPQKIALNRRITTSWGPLRNALIPASRSTPFRIYLTTDASSAPYVSGADTSFGWEEREGLGNDDREETEDESCLEDSDDEQDREDSSSDEGDFLVQEHARWLDAVRKAMVALEKKEASLQSERGKAQNVEETVARAQLIVSNLYLFPNPSTRSATVQDWENDGETVELTLDPKYESASDEANTLFAQARKLKRGSLVVQELLEATEQAMETLQDAVLDLESAVSPDNSVEEGRLRLIQDRLKRSSKQTNFRIPTEKSSSPSPRSTASRPKKRSDNIRKLQSPAGCLLLVGRNRRGNEYLSFQVARGKDIWMHARGCPGAHVLIQHRRGSPTPTDACLQMAANLAIFYSDARTERKAAVTAAEPKHLLKPRGAPLGAVKLREELQVLTGRPDDVPETLKLAREDSGLSDEYRSTDKAKHRRRTDQVAKQSQARKRTEQRAKRKRKGSRSSETER